MTEYSGAGRCLSTYDSIYYSNIETNSSKISDIDDLPARDITYRIMMKSEIETRSVIVPPPVERINKYVESPSRDADDKD